MDLPQGRSTEAVAPHSHATALGRVVAAQSPRPWHGCWIHRSSSQLAPEGTACLEQGSHSHSCKERPKSAAANPPTAQPQCHVPAAPWEPQLAVPLARTPQPWGHQMAPGCFTAPRAAESEGPHHWLCGGGQHLRSPRSSSAQGSALPRSGMVRQFAMTTSALPVCQPPPCAIPGS